MKKTMQPKVVPVLALFSLLVYLVAPLGLGTSLATAQEVPAEDTLIADPGNYRVIQVDGTGRIVWSYHSEDQPYKADRLPDSHTLITEEYVNSLGHGRVYEVDLDGNVTWEYTGTLDFVMNAKRLANGNTLIINTDHMGLGGVFEVTPAGEIVWQKDNLIYPYSAIRLLNGNTLIAISDVNDMSVIEVDPAGTIVWKHACSSYATDALVLDNGNVLIAEAWTHRVIEVDRATNEIVWQIDTGFNPVSIQRLANGNTLAVGGPDYRSVVREFDPAGTVVWEYAGGLFWASDAERVAPIENQPPIASAGGPYVTDTHSAVTLDASASRDPYGASLEYRWDFTNDGSWDTGWSTSPYISYTWATAFSGQTAVEVSDGELTTTAYAEVTVTQYVNQPPVANAGGPYVANENSLIALNASASADPSGDSLQYRWDFTNNGSWDTDWSKSAYFSYSWPDDFNGTVTVEVSDGELTNTATTEVTVNNVNPQTTIVTGVSAAGNYVVASTATGRTFFMDIVDGSLSSPSMIDDKADGMFGASVGDYDNDGVLETLAGDSYDVWYYDKTGVGNSFASAVSLSHDGQANRKRDFAEGDFTNDGNLDFVMASDLEGITLFIGHGDGTFTRQVVPLPAKSLPYGLDAADFNNDGQMDLAVTNMNAVYVFLGHGDGTFVSPISISVGITTVQGVAAGDFNGDGNADLVAGYSATNFLPGNGDGSFGKPSSLGFSVNSLTKADINQDGNLDLLATDGKSCLTSYVGRGDGTFTTAAYVNFKDSGIGGVAVGVGGPGTISGAEDRLTSFQATFTDQGYTDSHSATWDWGDGSTIENGVVTETNTAPAAKGTVTGSHRYDNAGEYTVSLTVTDDDGGSATDTAKVVIMPNTQPGSDVTVQPDPNVGVTFSGVTEGGTTTATVSDKNPGPGQAGFRFLGTYYDISTTATYTPPVTICLNYDDTGMPAGRENNLKIMHWDGATWTNATSSLDTVGNSICGTVSSFSWFAIAEEDTTPPVITITAPPQNATYLVNQVVTADWSAADEGTGLDSATGTTASGVAIDTATAGDKTYSVTATDVAGNTNTTQVTYHVRYANSGVLQPINLDGSSVFKLNRTIPIKFRAWDALSQAVSGATAQLYVTKISDIVFGQVLEPEVLVSGDNNGLFRYDATDQQYIYNLSTKGMTIGTYLFRIALGDGSEIYAIVSLR